MRLYRFIVLIVNLYLAMSLVGCGGSSDSQSNFGSGEVFGSGDVAGDDTGNAGGDTGGGDIDSCSGPWYQANLTWYESFPDPDSEECIEYNGCTWAGQFYGLEGTQTEQWVAAHDIASVHQKDWNWLGLQKIKIRQGDHEIIATVYDLCSDSDCNGCCTRNLGPVNPDGNKYLIDLESYTAQRFGSGSGTAEFQICDGAGGGDTGGSDTGGDTGSSGRWVPMVGDTWQWQLQGAVDTTYDVTAYDIDLFDSSAAAITQLHDQGRQVICYFSAGSYENWRPDAGDFASADLGNSLDGWPGERWLDIRSTGVRNIMTARLDLAAQKGCDAVEPDNVDGYTNGTGFPLSAADQLDYNRFLARQAHQRNLAVALKNDTAQAADLADDFDFTINEECHAYNECNTLSVFIAAGKPVFNAEYASAYVNDATTRQSLCTDALADGFSTLVLPLDLDNSFRFSCGAPNPVAVSGETQGALLGLYYGDESIAATSQKLQCTVPLHLTYYDFEHDWTGSVTQSDIQAGRIPLVNWEVFSATLDDIIGGAYDNMLARRAIDAKALGAQIFVDFGAEMNGDWSPWGGAQNGNSAAKYLAAYHHVHDALASADNITWLWCPNVTDEPRESWNAAMNYYPGDDYVDWTCVDGYNWGNAGGAGWQSFEAVFENIYPQLAAKNKPIMIGEMASAESGGSKAEFINGIVPTLKSKFPLIKGLVWFDINKETDWRISSSPESEAAFIKMATDPYLSLDQVQDAGN